MPSATDRKSFRSDLSKLGYDSLLTSNQESVFVAEFPGNWGKYYKVREKTKFSIGFQFLCRYSVDSVTASFCP